MTRSSLLPVHVLITLCLLWQGVLLFRAGRWSDAPDLPWFTLILVLPLVVILLAAWCWRQQRNQRAGLLILILLQATWLVTAAGGRLSSRHDPDAWLQVNQQILSTAVENEKVLLIQLEEAVTKLASDAVTGGGPDPDLFTYVASLDERWPALFAAHDHYPLATTLWHRTERVAWDDRTLPWPLPEDAPQPQEPWRMLQGWSEGWYWRYFVPFPDTEGPAFPAQPFRNYVLELQVQLTAGPQQSTGRDDVSHSRPGGDGVDLEATVVQVPRPLQQQWRGDATRGLWLTQDLPLGALAAREGHYLRVTASVPPWSQQEERNQARRFLLAVVLCSLSVAMWGWLGRTAMGLLIGLWLIRLLMVSVDFFRWFQPAFPEQHLPALPGEVTSLIDPAYFATPLAGGWFASAADAVLTALLVASTAWFIILSVTLRPVPSSDRVTSRWRRVTGLALGLLMAGVFLVLRSFVIEIVENANPRLIGPSVPFRFLTFWALHLVLLMISGSAIGLVSLLVTRWRRYAQPWQFTLAALLGAAAVTLAVPGVAPAVRVVLLVAFLVLWWVTPLAQIRGVPLRRLYLAVPLLVTVLWNYSILAEAYSHSEMVWLQRKGDQIVQPQDEWIQFLTEDVLQEMATFAAREGLPSGEEDRATTQAGELWRNRAAFDLWHGSAVRDLGLPCLVELLDGEGYSLSLFASGFFSDFGYEVSDRSPWRRLDPLEPAAEAAVLVQTELRRYPTGEERILRGEIPRTDVPGWVRLELSVQSGRISTLLARLAGSQPDPGASGYQPRAEVDRPVLLLRGDSTGWQDAGPAGYPDASAAPVISALQEGRIQWGTVKVAGESYRCLWREFPGTYGRVTGEGFLLGLQQPSFGDRLLDLSRLMLVDLILFGMLALLWQVLRLFRGQATVWRPGFQERFLAGYLALGLLLLIMAGMSVDRLSLERIDADARSQTRNGLATALGQLRGLLAEQARALAESEYIADLLANRLAGDRPLGPFAARQAMVFAADGRLLLDETLSDLDANESTILLNAARQAPLMVQVEGGDLYLSTVIPIDLSEVMPDVALQDTAVGPAEPGGSRGPVDDLGDHGFFFYRQQADGDLVTGLAEIIQGEVTLRVAGEVMLASHPEQIFSGSTPLLAPPEMIRWLQSHPTHPFLYPGPGTRLSFTGCMALPTLVVGEAGLFLRQLDVPSVLAVEFPTRGRDLATQREQTVLYLAGLSSLILLAAVILALLMAWNIFGPVRILVTATQRLASGDFAAPLPEAGRDEVGRLATSFRSMRDKLQLTQTVLAERERFLTTVLDRVPVGVVVYADDGLIVALNPSGEQILEQFYGMETEADSQPAASLLAGFRELFGTAPQAEGELHSSDGRRTLRCRQAPLALPDGRQDTMIVFEDVTEFLANKRLALNAELARQVAHEIKNPLTPIQLSIQHLNQAYNDEAPELDRIVSDTVERVLEQVRLLRSIASEFSLLGRPGDLTCEPLDWPELVQKVITGYQTGLETADSGPRVDVNRISVPPVLGHRESLIKVLSNLMENSIEACGGLEKLNLSLNWEVSDAQVTLVWADNGPGLTAEVALRLFDPYFSTKSTGTGLGLAICRNLLDKMDGGIHLGNRTDGPGAVAKVTLPQFFEDDTRE